MVSAGLRLVLEVAVPLLGTAVVHELRRHRIAALVIALATVATCIALALSIAGAVAGGVAVERSLGSALPGVDLTARGDSASVVIVLTSCAAALLAVVRNRWDGERLAGILLCLGGSTLVADSANLVLAATGIEVIAAGTLLLRGRQGPGARSAGVLAAVLCAAGLAVFAAAAQLVAVAGTSDFAFLPAGAVGGAVAVPWAVGGAALMASVAIPGEGANPARDWSAIAALPAGFLVLLRLQETAAGQLPGSASVALAVGGALLAVIAAVTGRRAVTLAAAGRAAVAVLTGVLISLLGRPLQTSGTVTAGLFLAIEAGLLAAPSWNRRPTVWSSASIGLLALPGGAAFAVLAVGLAEVVHGGVAAFPQAVILTATVCFGAIAVARSVDIPARRWGAEVPGAMVAVGAALAGGLLPGLALRTIAAWLAGGAAGADLDSGALALPGGGFAGGYFALAAAVLVIAVVSALLLATDEAVAGAVPEARPLRLPPVAPLLRVRRRTAPSLRRGAVIITELDRWLESQPGFALVVAAVVLAIVYVH